MDIKEYLGQLKKIDAMIRNKIYERDHMFSIATRSTPTYGGERVQSSTSQQRMADAVDAIVDAEKEIDRCIDELVDKRKEVISLIEQLDEKEYDFLHLKYVQYYTLEEIANMNGKSYSWATYMHGVALEHVRKILKEREK